MVLKGYEIIKEVVESNGTLSVKFPKIPNSKKQKAMYDYAMEIMHLIGSTISEDTPLCEFKELENGFLEMVFTSESIMEVYNFLVEEGVING